MLVSSGAQSQEDCASTRFLSLYSVTTGKVFSVVARIFLGGFQKRENMEAN